MSNDLKWGMGGTLLLHMLLLRGISLTTSHQLLIDVVQSPSSLQVNLVTHPKLNPVVDSPSLKEMISEKLSIKEDLLKDATERNLIESSAAPLLEKTLEPEPLLENLLTGAMVEASPQQFQNQPPIYPRIARERGYTGSVKIKVKIDTQGQVLEAWIISSSGKSILDKAALKAVRRWQFEPATRFGMAVISDLEIPFLFQLN